MDIINSMILHFPGLNYLMYSIIAGLIAYIIISKTPVRYNSSKNACTCIAFAIGYLVFILSITVFSRNTLDNPIMRLQPLWTYIAVFEADATYKKLLFVQEIIENILLFIPLGFLLHEILGKNKLMVVILAVVVSSSIEFLQFSLRKGLCETDDVIHNTLGTLLGYYVCPYLKNLVNWLSNYLRKHGKGER